MRIGSGTVRGQMSRFLNTRPFWRVLAAPAAIEIPQTAWSIVRPPGPGSHGEGDYDALDPWFDVGTVQCSLEPAGRGYTMRLVFLEADRTELHRLLKKPVHLALLGKRTKGSHQRAHEIGGLAYRSTHRDPAWNDEQPVLLPRPGMPWQFITNGSTQIPFTPGPRPGACSFPMRIRTW